MIVFGGSIRLSTAHKIDMKSLLLSNDLQAQAWQFQSKRQARLPPNSPNGTPGMKMAVAISRNTALRDIALLIGSHKTHQLLIPPHKFYLIIRSTNTIKHQTC